MGYQRSMITPAGQKICRRTTGVSSDCGPSGQKLARWPTTMRASAATEIPPSLKSEFAKLRKTGGELAHHHNPLPAQHLTSAWKRDRHFATSRHVVLYSTLHCRHSKFLPNQSLFCYENPLTKRTTICANWNNTLRAARRFATRFICHIRTGRLAWPRENCNGCTPRGSRRAPQFC